MRFFNLATTHLVHGLVHSNFDGASAFLTRRKENEIEVHSVACIQRQFPSVKLIRLPVWDIEKVCCMK